MLRLQLDMQLSILIPRTRIDYLPTCSVLLVEMSAKEYSAVPSRLHRLVYFRNGVLAVHPFGTSFSSVSMGRFGC